MIFTKKLSHDYLKKDDEGNVIGKVRALDDVNVHVKPGIDVCKAHQCTSLSDRGNGHSRRNGYDQ